MKNFAFIVFVCSAWFSFAQPFQSVFGDSSTFWSVIPAGYCDNTCNIDLHVDSDTIINQESYKILPAHGYLREDTVTGRIWFYNESENQEFLVMDLSLNTGDPFTIYDFAGTPTIVTVDSTSIIGGEKHVYLDAMISICSLTEPIMFVEGSGPNAGFNYQKLSYVNETPSYMLCHSKNNVPITGNILFQDECNICHLELETVNKELPTLLKISDILGREIMDCFNIPMYYHYSDGTVQKIYKTR